MAASVLLTLLIACFITHNSALLFHDDNIPGHTTTLGPLRKDATLSLLVKNVLDLEARVKINEQEIQSLKHQKVSIDNVSNGTLNNLMSEYTELKIAFGIIKQKLEQNNNLTLLQALKTRQDSMAQSIRYLTLSLRDNEIQDEETNKTMHEEIDHLNAKLRNELQDVNIMIQNFTGCRYRINQYQSMLETTLAGIGSELGSLTNERSFVDYALRVYYKSLTSKYIFSFVSSTFYLILGR